jgi:hypothetical protein
MGVSTGPGPTQSQVLDANNSSLATNAKDVVLSYTPPYTLMPTIPVNADLLRDGARGRIILRIAKEGTDAFNWLIPYAGLDVTVNVPHLGIFWTSTMSYRRGGRYLYVRIPARLRKYLLPFWQSNMVIPVVIMVPPVSLLTRVSRVVPHEQ